MTNKITLIKALQPNTVSKKYSTDANGHIIKQSVANISRGLAKSVDVNTAEDMVELLEKVSESTNLALCSGVWRESDKVKTFNLITQSELSKRLGSPQDKITELVKLEDGSYYGARIKAMVEPSSWVLLDCDSPEHMPVDMARMTLSERLEALETVVAGISTCERIEMRSSSSRVSLVGGSAGMRSHAWIRISDPSKIDALRAYIRAHSIIEGIYYEQPLFSRSTGVKIGSVDRTLIDLAVIDRARLTFVAMPVVDDEAWDIERHSPDICIVNKGAGAMDVADIELPDASVMLAVNDARGTNETLNGDNGHFIFNDTDSLRKDTPITVKGDEQPLSDWLGTMREMNLTKLRCEAPFRKSESEAGILRITDSGDVLIHDVGNNTNYKLSIDLAEAFGGVEVENGDLGGQNDNEDAQGGAESKVSKTAMRLAKRITIAINKSLRVGKAYDEEEHGKIEDDESGESDTENEVIVCDPRVVDKMLSNTFYFSSGTMFTFCNNKNQLVEYKRADVWGALVETFGSPVDAKKLYKETQHVIDSLDEPTTTEINKFAKGVRNIAQTMVVDHIKLYQQRKSMAISVDMFAKSARVELSTDSVTVVFPHERLHGMTPLFNQTALDDYKKHFPRLDDFLKFIVAARFSSDRKKAHLWIKADSDWGKDLLMNALKELHMVVDLSVKEVETALEGRPISKDANSFKRAIVAHFNEFKSMKSELKQLENGITISPKHQMEQRVPLYGKIFASAEDVSGLVTENGVENQFANRFCVFNESGSILERPLFNELGGAVYKDSIQRYVCDEVNRMIEGYIKLGRIGALTQADKDLKGFVEKHSIKNMYDTLDEQIDNVAEDFVQWVRDAYALRPEEDMAFLDDDAPNLYLKDKGSRGRLLEQFCHVLGPDSQAVIITKPSKVINDWLREMYHGADYFVMRFKAKVIVEKLGGIVVRKDAFSKSRKGIRIDYQ